MAPAPLFLPVADSWIEIRIENDELAAQIAQLWEHLVVTEPPAGAEAEPVTIGAEINPKDPSAAYVASGLITRAVITALRGRYLLLHGAALARDGKAIAMVAPSGMGKSTAAVTLGAAPDVEYLTDECVIIDPRTWSVYSYPKPVSRVVSRDPFFKADFAPAELGLAPGREPRALAGVYLLQRDGGAPQLENAPLVETLSDLAPLTSSLDALESPLGTVATMLDHVDSAQRVNYAESSGLGELLWSGVRKPSGERSWEQLPPWNESTLATGDPARREQIRRGQYQDALVGDDGVAVLREGQVMRLAGLTALIWLLLLEHGPLTHSALETAISHEIGSSADAP